MTLLTILLLAVITFTTRYLFTHPTLPITLNANAQKFLSYSAPCVLTAIWVPIIFAKDHQLVVDAASPYIWGAAIAIVAAKYTKSIYFTAIAGGVVFVALRIFSSY